MKNLKIKNLKLITMLLIAGISFASPVSTYAEEGDILYIQEEDEHKEEDLTEETKEAMIAAAEAAAAENTGTNDGDNLSADSATGTGVGEAIGEGANAATGDDTNTTGADGDGEKREYGEDEFIDADNWSQDQDIVENAGESIPEGTQTEAQRKNINPLEPETPETPPGNPETPPGNPETPPGNPGTPPGNPETPETPITPDTPEEDTPAPKTGETDLDYYLPYVKTGAGLFCVGAGLALIIHLTKKGKAYVEFLNEQDDLEIDDEPKRVIASKKKSKRKNKRKSLRRN